MIINEYLVKLRKEANIPQLNISRKSKIEQSRLSRIERGEVEPSFEEIKSYLEALDSTEADEVLSFINKPFSYFTKPHINHPQRSLLTEVDSLLIKVNSFLEKDNIPTLFRTQLTTYKSQIMNLAEFLLRLEHNITFIGDIGCGKTTAICSLMDLVLPKSDKKDILSKRTVLATGSGRMTLCEVIVSTAENFGISIEPHSEREINLIIEEFCRLISDESLISENDDVNNNGRVITEELERLIRNMAGLSKRIEKKEDGSTIIIDPAKELLKSHIEDVELREEVLSRIKFNQRTNTHLWSSEASTEKSLEWLQKTFSEINSGRAINFSIPRVINVYVPTKVLNDENLFINIIDSKGIDETAIRPDVKKYIENLRTIIVFCSRFNDAPSVSIQELIKHRKNLGDESSLEKRSLIFILPQNDEVKQTKLPDGSSNVESDEEGYEIKKNQVEKVIKALRININPIVVYNSIIDNPKSIQDILLMKINEYRALQINQIKDIVSWSEELMEKYSEELLLKVQEKVIKLIKNWSKDKLIIELKPKAIHQLLLRQIQLSHAQTVRATNYRTGSWPNLNYYQLIGEGGREITLSNFKENLTELRGILVGLLKNDEFNIAENFIKSLIFELDSKIEMFLNDVENSARNTFSFPIQSDLSLWQKCVSRWGQGPNYREDIKNYVEDWFKDNLKENLHQHVTEQVQKHWQNHIIKMFEKYFN